MRRPTDSLPMKIAELVEIEGKKWGLELSPDTLKKVQTYYDILQHWNRKINLTSVRCPLEWVRHHLLEGLYALRFIPFYCTRHLDIGTGAGFPAIPLKLVRGDLSQTLLEARKKKAVFLKQVVRALDLENVHVVSERFETFVLRSSEMAAIDLVTMRAVDLPPRPLADLVRRLKTGSWLALWHGARSDILQRMSTFKVLKKSLHERLPYSEKRYLSLFHVEHKAEPGENI